MYAKSNLPFSFLGITKPPYVNNIKHKEVFCQFLFTLSITCNSIDYNRNFYLISKSVSYNRRFSIFPKSVSYNRHFSIFPKSVSYTWYFCSLYISSLSPQLSSLFYRHTSTSLSTSNTPSKTVKPPCPFHRDSLDM